MADQQFSPRNQLSPRIGNCFNTLTISGGILLLILACLISLAAATLLALVFLPPLILISNHIWMPLGILIFIHAAGFVSFLGFAVVAAAVALSWLYRYFRSFHVPDSEQFDYARNRYADVTSHAKDYISY